MRQMWAAFVCLNSRVMSPYKYTLPQDIDCHGVLSSVHSCKFCSFFISGATPELQWGSIWNMNTQASSCFTALYPLFKQHVYLIWLQLVGLAASALFHLKIIICYGNSRCQIDVAGAWAMNKYKIVHPTGCELLLGLEVASCVCHPSQALGFRWNSLTDCRVAY